MHFQSIIVECPPQRTAPVPLHRGSSVAPTISRSGSGDPNGGETGVHHEAPCCESVSRTNFEFLLKREHSRSCAEWTYLSGVSVNSSTARSNKVGEMVLVPRSNGKSQHVPSSCSELASSTASRRGSLLRSSREDEAPGGIQSSRQYSELVRPSLSGGFPKCLANCSTVRKQLRIVFSE